MILIVGLGIFPKPIVDIIKPAVESTMQHVGVTDKAPEIPVTEGQK
jgi:NADH-quinone oxidoreductase subunit M